MKKLSKILLIVLALLLSWIIMTGILDYDPIIYKYNPFYVAAGTAILMLVELVIYKKIIDKIKNTKIFAVVCLSIFSLLCVIFGIIFKVNPSWDMGSVYKIAQDWANTGTYQNDYICMYPNNVAITMMYMIIFKIMHVIFKISNYISVATVFNSLIVATSGVLLNNISKEFLNEKNRKMLLLNLICMTPFYMYSSIYYSDTLSIFISLLIMQFFLWGIRSENKAKKCIFFILCGLTIAFGFNIKITSVFIVVAILVYSILNFKEVKSKVELKKIIIPVLIGIVIFTALFKFIVNIKFLNDKEKINKNKLPYEHWLVLGLNGNGGYNQEIWENIIKFQTYNDKKQEAKRMIKKEISEYDSNTFVKHITNKLKYAWSDGTYFAPEKLRREPVKENFMHELVLATGKYNKFYKYIPQIMHFSMLIYTLIYLIYIIKNNNFKTKDVILYILIFGFIVFFMIWENRSRYIITVVPMIMILKQKGIEILSRKGTLSE